MTLPLNGFSISNFKSFYGPQQLVGPLKQINVIIGENNSGKSNIARYLRKVVSVASTNAYVVSAEDIPKNNTTFSSKYTLNLKTKSSLIGVFARTEGINSNIFEQHLEYFLGTIGQKADPNKYWLPSNLWLANNFQEFIKDKELLSITHDDQKKVENVWRRIKGSSGGGFAQHWLPELLQTISRASVPQFTTEYISAARKVETNLPNYVEELGHPSVQAKQFIQELAKFSSPTAENYVASQTRWASVTDFVRKLLRDPSIELEIPYSQDTILIKQHNRILNLEETGTGIHQAVLLAARVTTAPHPIVIIEEPETHFHPELQRQLMQYFAAQKDKQFFITTHSAHIMDAVDAAVISVRIENGYSVIEMPMNRVERHQICHRLGYRPSDLMQANALIWIEGPSDRIYLNHWIKSVAPEIEEGWHYSFSIYGGRLLSRFTADDANDVDELIALLPINRFPFVVMDSDRKNEGDDINETKKRIQKELGNSVWITAGREIENYATWDRRNNAVVNIHKAVSLQLPQTEETPLDHPLSYFKEGKCVTSNFDKPKIAEHVCGYEADLSILDLKDKIELLVAFIKNANRMN